MKRIQTLKRNLFAFFFLLILFSNASAFAQNCNCALAFKWVKNAFEENDAGFQYGIEDNGSTSEQFLLAARQSKKVKLFGTTTLGELDISNMYPISSPDQKYTLWYCTSKSLRIPENTIDNKGIAPDFFIDKSIPKKQWLSYIVGVLKDW